MNTPSCSVIVPVYNVAEYLPRCINSLTNQTERNIEIILVNDGSTDESTAICREAASSDSRIVLIEKSNGGLSSARNAGLEIARGEFILFVDSDDYVSSDFCEEALSCFEKSGSDMVIFGFDTIFTDKGKTVHHHTKKPGIIRKEEVVHGLLIDGYINSLAWNKAYRRSLFDGVRYPEGVMFEDVGTTYRLVDKASSFHISDRITYYYGIRSDSISGKWWLSDRKINDFFLVRTNQLEYIKQSFPSLLKEAYATTGFVALMGSVFSAHKNKDITEFLAKEKKNLISTGFPYGFLFRISYLFPKLTEKVLRLIFR